MKSSVIFENKKIKLLHHDSNITSELDAYQWSQFCAIRPEYKEVRFQKIEDFRQLANLEIKRQEALDFALEIMDISLSEDYRKSVYKILGNLLNDNDDLFSFVKNRLYSTPLPGSFNADQAHDLLANEFEKVASLYKNLKAKTTFFAYFYTLFTIELSLEVEKLEKLNQTLTDFGNYEKFTTALYESSKKKYDLAAFDTLVMFKELHIVHSPNIFFEIETKLKSYYKVSLSNEAALIAENVVVKETETVDDILRLIEDYYSNKQGEHDAKKAKRGKAKKVDNFIADIVDVVEELKKWAKKHAYKGDDAFLHEFKDIVKKQLRSSKPEQLCKTCCDMASYFVQANRFALAKKLLNYAKVLNSEDVVLYTQEAELYKKLGNLKYALELYDWVIDKFDEDIVAYNGRAGTLRSMGKYKEALQEYDKTLMKFGEDCVTYNGKAGTLRDMGKYSEALEQYEATIKKFENDPVAYSGKAETLRDMGKYSEALQQYDININKFESDIVSYSGKAETLKDMGKYSEALEQYDQTIIKFNDDIVVCAGKAETLRVMGKYSEALQLYEDLIRRSDDNVVACNGRSGTLKDMGRYPEALEQYEKTIKKFGDNSYAYNGKAETLRDMGRYSEALLQYETNIKKFGENVYAHTGKAETLRDMRKYNKALQQYEETINKFSENNVAYNGRAETLRDMGEYKKALLQYEETIIKFDQDSVAYNGRAGTLRDMGKHTEALLQYDESILKFGENVVAYNGKAKTLMNLGRYNEALQIYDWSLQKNKRNRIAQSGRFKLFLETNNLENHLTDLMKTEYQSYDDFFDLHIYSMFLIKSGDWDKALDMINLGLKSPHYNNRTHFKRAASFLKILQKQYDLALTYFNSSSLNTPIENLLATHALAAVDQTNRAIEIFNKIEQVEASSIKTTLGYISERYTLNNIKISGKSQQELDRLIVEGEMKALLEY